MKTWFHPQHELATKFLFARQWIGNRNAIFMEQLNPLLHRFAKLGINKGFVFPMNCTDENLRAPADKTVVFVTRFDVFDISRCLFL